MRSQSRSRESRGQGMADNDALTRVLSEQGMAGAGDRSGMVGSDMIGGGMVERDGHV